MGRFVEVCRRKDLKVNADMMEVMVLNGEEGHMSEMRLEHVSKFK